MSLRTQLLATALGLLALISLVLSGTTEIAVRRLLLNAKDQQLVAAGARGREQFDPNQQQYGGNGSSGSPSGSGTQPYGQTSQGPASLGQMPAGCSATDVGNTRPAFPPGQPAGTVAAHIQKGQVCWARMLDGSRQNGQNGVPLASALWSTFLTIPPDARGHTVNLAGKGDYRVIAILTNDGDVIVTGLPVSDMETLLSALTLVEVSVALAGLLLAGSAGAVLIRRELRPLRRVAATASRVSELPLDRGEVALSVRVPTVDTDPRTEVGQVGSALNRMLGHVGAALRARQASEVRMRQFLADASHELRTPLAAIRGYAELSRRMDDVPPDVAHSMRRVESEARRMTTLVEDLLLLARLDSGRPLDRDPVDLSQLVVDVVSDAHAAGPDHQWQLDLPEEPVYVIGDKVRLHQVLANLLANARTHTPPGTRVTVRLTAAGDQVRLDVADNGPGIPAELLPEVFNRFARADTSRSRAAGSTGLGLAIVAAVVDSHHGAVTVASEPGFTLFTVTLPRTANA
ncbi:MAG TPA: ATP-binding protein [Rugosimonospora sp.]|nr:ATP-binding protein [Rugosimonospora sp.]